MNGRGAADGTGYLGTAVGGRYRLEEEIARGGMSTVYRAFDLVLQRPVALKLMEEALATEPAQLERFRREARAVAQLSHPHIVTVIDFSEGGDSSSCADLDPSSCAGRAYIVFEYVEGETLKSLIAKEGRLDPLDALAYALDVAEALAAAHEHMVVHRDVKPQNILIGQEGIAKITDFGIARMLTEQGLTIDGRVLGTADYVSPEQALGERVGVQSDIYSLGVVLYEMLTGCLPFSADNQVALAMCHVRERIPDVQLLRPELSATTAAVVERATAKDLPARCKSMDAMIAGLEQALEVESARALVNDTEPGPGHRVDHGREQGRDHRPDQRRDHAPERRPGARLRGPLRLVGALVAIAAIAIAAVMLSGGGAVRGRGVPPRTAQKRPRLEPVPASALSAHDYNPFGTEEEDPEQVGSILAGGNAAAWSTEHYYEDALNKPGTGVYLDASTALLVPALRLRTPTPGFTIAVYGSNGFTGPEPYGQSTSLTQRGWTLLSTPVSAHRRMRITLHPNARPYRFYLLWIEKLPKDRESAEIAQVTLLREG